MKDLELTFLDASYTIDHTINNAVLLDWENWFDVSLMLFDLWRLCLYEEH